MYFAFYFDNIEVYQLLMHSSKDMYVVFKITGHHIKYDSLNYILNFKFQIDEL